MTRRLAILFAASCLINLALAAVGRGSGGQVIALFFILSIGLIAVCIGSLVLLVVKMGWAPPAFRRFAMRAIAIGFVAGSCLVSLPIGLLVNRYDMEEAKNYCDRLRPAIERYRRETGRYPESLSQVAKGQLPRLLQGREFYRSSEDDYSFMFLNPRGMLEGVESDSRSPVWREFD